MRFHAPLIADWFLKTALALGLALAVVAPAVRAEFMQITDLLGRSIRAEPISLDGENLKIRREDGAEFTIELKTLADEDQARLRAWAAEQAKADPADAFSSAPASASASAKAEPEKKKEPPKYVPDYSRVTLELSRFKAETNTIAKFEGYSHKHEMWGYSFQVTNRNLHASDGLRIEYNLFARTFADSGTPAVVPGEIDLPSIGSTRSETARTKTAEVCKRKGSWVYNESGELRGIWVKLYAGDQLIREEISPTSLKTEVDWTKPSEASARVHQHLVGDGYIY
jgi:hypothetical protein